MSRSAARESRQRQRLCETCRQRKARYRFRGRVRADRQHTLCFACFRSLRGRRSSGPHHPSSRGECRSSRTGQAEDDLLHHQGASQPVRTFDDDDTDAVRFQVVEECGEAVAVAQFLRPAHPEVGVFLDQGITARFREA